MYKMKTRSLSRDSLKLHSDVFLSRLDRGRGELVCKQSIRQTDNVVMTMYNVIVVITLYFIPTFIPDLQHLFLSSFSASYLTEETEAPHPCIHSPTPLWACLPPSHHAWLHGPCSYRRPLPPLLGDWASFLPDAQDVAPAILPSLLQLIHSFSPSGSFPPPSDTASRFPSLNTKFFLI